MNWIQNMNRCVGPASWDKNKPKETAMPEKMIEVPAAEANNYSRILTLLGMEEEGDPVAEVERLRLAIEKQRLDLVDAGNEVNAFIDTTRRLNEKIDSLKPDARRYQHARLGMRYSLSKDRALTEDEVDEYCDARLGVNHG